MLNQPVMFWRVSINAFRGVRWAFWQLSDCRYWQHSWSAEQFTAIGPDVECVVLARAVDWFLRNMILLNDDKTIVFQ
jgi:hypothetical protein